MNNFSNAVEYIEYVFDSAEALRSNLSGYTSRNWPTFSFENAVDNVMAFKIIEVNIPNSFYAVTTLNNTFVMTNITDSLSYTITVPIGTYTATTLIATLKTQLDAASLNWTVTFSASTGKLSFTTSPLHDISFTFGAVGNDGTTNMRLIMGFNAGVSASGTTLVSPNFIDVSGPDYLYVNSDTLGPNITLYLPSTDPRSKGGVGPEMAKVPVNVNFMESIIWQDPAPQYFFSTPGINQLQSIDFYLTAGVGYDVIDLNGLPFSIKLGILKRKDAQNNEYMGVKRMRAI